LDSIEKRLCNNCKIKKVDTDFPFRKDGRYYSPCKECRRKYQREYVKRIPDPYPDKKKYKSRWRAYSLKADYGLSLEEYNKILDKQGGVCAICLNPCTSGKNLGVDHCHKTNKIRGLLCQSCNTGLGKFRDNRKLLNKAISYLWNAKKEVQWTE